MLNETKCWRPRSRPQGQGGDQTIVLEAEANVMRMRPGGKGRGQCYEAKFLALTSQHV